MANRIQKLMSRRGRRLAALLLVLATLMGCALFEPDMPDTEPGLYYSHARALQLLHEGQERLARALVIERLDAEPDDRRAQNLLRQIEEPPQELLGAEYFIHEVQSGETLGMLAERYLGDADRFYSLARYNDIDRPALLRVGQELRIPQRYAAEPEPPDPEAEAPREAERAYERGVAASDAGDQAAAAVAYREALEHDPDHEGARQALDALPDPDAELEEEPSEVELAFERATAARRAGDVAAAGAAYREVLALDPDHRQARQALQMLRDTAVPDLHREAVLLYRNQKLDEAIGLWDDILAVDPGFQRARDYRSRAVELRSRLEDLD